MLFLCACCMHSVRTVASKKIRVKSEISPNVTITIDVSRVHSSHLNFVELVSTFLLTRLACQTEPICKRGKKFCSSWRQKWANSNIIPFEEPCQLELNGA